MTTRRRERNRRRNEPLRLPDWFPVYQCRDCGRARQGVAAAITHVCLTPGERETEGNAAIPPGPHRVSEVAGREYFIYGE